MRANSVTVLIPTFNRSEFLLESLTSILAQTRSAKEIIIVNDGSTDDTLELLKPYEGRVRVLSKPNGGKAAALNFGLKRVTSDLVWIFDDDDIAAPNALEVLVGLLEANPDADIAYGRHERFSVDPGGEVCKLGTGYWRNCQPDDFLVETLDDMFAHQQGMIVRRSLYLLAGTFDEELVRSQDYDMLIRLARFGTVESTQEVVFFQRVHHGRRGSQAEGLDASQRDAAWSRFDRDIFRKHYRELKLSDYLGKRQSILNPMNKRHALIRRASVMGRKKLWYLALLDLRAAEATSQRPLSIPEIAALRSTFSSKYGCDDILDNTKLIDQLCELATSSTIGSEIVSAMARGLRWKVRAELFKFEVRKLLRYLLTMRQLKKAANMPVSDTVPADTTAFGRAENAGR